MFTLLKGIARNVPYSRAAGLSVPFAIAASLHIGVAVASAPQKVIEVEGQHRSDAVAITEVKVGNADVQCGLIVSPAEVQPVSPFQAGDDWLANTVVTLLNRTSKTVVAGQLILVFPETGDGSIQKPLRVYNISLGRLPASVAFSGSTGKPISQPPAAQPLSFAPGQTLAIHIGDSIAGIVASVAHDMPFPSVTKCIIRRGAFFFDDGMRWYGTGYSVPDPDNAGKFKPMDRRYFPGIPSWPPGSHN